VHVSAHAQAANFRSAVVFRASRHCRYQRLAAQQPHDNRHFAPNGKTLGAIPINPNGRQRQLWGSAPALLRTCARHHSSCTPVEVQFTSAGCLNYPCRTPLAVSLISATTSFAQYKTFDRDSTYPSYSSRFGYPSYAGGESHEPTFGSAVQSLSAAYCRATIKVRRVIIQIVAQ
jgi:hypothetical protein